ncbi:MAG: 16S rRNA (cytosine(1402)-N(4))-methyltransferase RsmH [Planctomycetota bacterium]|nr:16S rRNA (cytosine(1402)-N(4))-methyltransferase RsmH [Planctomycetota bacterium]
MDLPATGHESVLLDEVLSWVAPRPGGTVVDCTVGRGGHSLAIAQRMEPSGLLIGLDVDQRNLEYAQPRLAEARTRVRLFYANFANIADVLKEAQVDAVDGILADLGLSTNQFLDPQYGMSFAQDMPLDMRLDLHIRQTAADLVNHLREQDLADVLYNLAQERYSRRIARKITEARRISPITTTGRLAEIVRSAIGRRSGAPEKIDPATRTFLALRMCVNQEIQKLQAFLATAPKLLKPGGRLAVISFQSTEDRLVKQAFRSTAESGLFDVLTRKPISPTEAEIARNPRSRSAKLRVLLRRPEGQ